MMNHRQIFLNHIAQTSPAPLQFEIVKAKGNYLYDADGKRYLDLIGGISVSNTGHGNRKIIHAIKQQAEKYLHVMVNGELILNPQTSFAKLLTEHLPASLNSVFYTSSGSEATEGAMKLAKRYTGRPKIAAFKNSYHGSTQGALSIMGDEYWRNAFRPLLPGTIQLIYNDFESLHAIQADVACVIAETIQAEAGVIVPNPEWLQALRQKCTETGTLLILDEIQCGMGRNGTLFAFEQFGVVPDILLVAKAFGGGMPLGAFIADKALMDSFTQNPVLGHINTFGGHSVCCAAGQASMEYLLEKKLIAAVAKKEALFLKQLRKISAIRAIRSRGLMMALEFSDESTAKQVAGRLLHSGVFLDWFLFAPQCLRIAPPLTISLSEIRLACEKIKAASRLPSD